MSASALKASDRIILIVEKPVWRQQEVRGRVLSWFWCKRPELS